MPSAGKVKCRRCFRVRPKTVMRRAASGAPQYICIDKNECDAQVAENVKKLT